MSKVLTILYILPSIVFANLKHEFPMYSLDQAIEKMQYITPGLVDTIKQTWGCVEKVVLGCKDRAVLRPRSGLRASARLTEGKAKRLPSSFDLITHIALYSQYTVYQNVSKIIDRRIVVFF